MKTNWEVINKADGKVIVSAERVAFWAQQRGKSAEDVARSFTKCFDNSAARKAG